MANVLSPELIQLIEGFKPYLGEQGKSFADTALKVINAVSSPPVRDAYDDISSMLPQLSEKLLKNFGRLSPRGWKGSFSREAAKPVSKDEEDVPSLSPVKTNQTPGVQEFVTNNFALILFLILILLFFGDGGW